MTVSKSSRTSHSELIGHARRWAEGCARKSGRAAHHEPLVSLSWPQRTSRASDPKNRGAKREARAYRFLRSCNHYQTLSVSSSVTNLANDGGRWAARLSLCHRSWRPTGWHLVVRSSTSLWRRWWSSVRSNVLRRPANRFSAGAGAVPSWAGPLRAPSSQAGVLKVAALPALNELEDAWLAYRQGGCTGPPRSFPRG